MPKNSQSSLSKGISPLIATVLLIVVVVTLTGLLISFSTSFIRGTTDVVENRSGEAVECTGASISIEDVFITNGTSGSARVQVVNDGLKGDLTIVTGQLFNKTGGNFVANNTPIAGFNKGDIEIVLFTNVDMPSCANFSHVTITTTCPNAIDTFRKAPKC